MTTVNARIQDIMIMVEVVEEEDNGEAEREVVGGVSGREDMGMRME